MRGTPGSGVGRGSPGGRCKFVPHSAWLRQLPRGPGFETRFCAASCVTLGQRAPSLGHLLVQPCRICGRGCGHLAGRPCSRSAWLGGGTPSQFCLWLFGCPGEKAIENATVQRLMCCSVPARPCRRLSLMPVFAQSKHWPQSTEHRPVPELGWPRTAAQTPARGAGHCCGCLQQPPHAWWAQEADH